MKEKEPTPALHALAPPTFGHIVTDYLAVLSRAATKRYLLLNPPIDRDIRHD